MLDNYAYNQLKNPIYGLIYRFQTILNHYVRMLLA